MAGALPSLRENLCAGAYLNSTCEQPHALIPCKFCNNKFCLAHYNCEAHKCFLVEKRRCSRCDKIVYYKKGTPKEEAFYEHYRNGTWLCEKPSYVQCSAIGCEEQNVCSWKASQCNNCSTIYCYKHRDVYDHNCKGSPTGQNSAKLKKLPSDTDAFTSEETKRTLETGTIPKTGAIPKTGVIPKTKLLNDRCSVIGCDKLYIGGKAAGIECVCLKSYCIGHILDHNCVKPTRRTSDKFREREKECPPLLPLPPLKPNEIELRNRLQGLLSKYPLQQDNKKEIKKHSIPHSPEREKECPPPLPLLPFPSLNLNEMSNRLQGLLSKIPPQQDNKKEIQKHSIPHRKGRDENSKLPFVPDSVASTSLEQVEQADEQTLKSYARKNTIKVDCSAFRCKGKFVRKGIAPEQCSACFKYFCDRHLPGHDCCPPTSFSSGTARMIECSPSKKANEGSPEKPKIDKADVIKWYHETEQSKNVGVKPHVSDFEPWFHGPISREEAEALMKPEPVGSYLVSISDSTYGYNLTYKLPLQKLKFYIEAKEDGKYYTEDKALGFNSLSELVEYYKQNPLRKYFEASFSNPVGQRDPTSPDYLELFTY